MGFVTGDGVEIRALRADDDLEAQLDLAERAFGVKSADERAQWLARMGRLVESGTFFGAFAGGRTAGAAVFFDMRQWWCGRAMPMAGVSGVKVAPEDRGRGIGRRLMTALLDEIAARGYPVAALCPATMQIYRSLGWELAGSRYSVRIPGHSLRSLVPPDAIAGNVSAGTAPDAIAPRNLRRATPADAAAVIDVIGRVHEAARDSGPLTWDVASMANRLAEPDMYAYLCDDGFTSYHWHDGNNALFVQRVQGISAETVRELWSVIASHATIAETIHAWAGPADPLWWLTRERDPDITHRSMWMLRVVDAPAAIAARGFPPTVTLAVPLIINDQSRPANSGRWMLSVAGGKGELVPAASGTAAVTLGARGLAALFAGTPMATLRLAGLAAAGDGNTDTDTDAGLDAAFAANAYLLDGF